MYFCGNLTVMSASDNSLLGNTDPAQQNNTNIPQPQHIDLRVIAQQLGVSSTTGPRQSTESTVESAKYFDNERMISQYLYQYLLQQQLKNFQTSPVLRSDPHKAQLFSENQILHQSARSTPFEMLNSTPKAGESQKLQTFNEHLTFCCNIGIFNDTQK